MNAQFALNLPKQTAIDATEDDEKIVVKKAEMQNWLLPKRTLL